MNARHSARGQAASAGVAQLSAYVPRSATQRHLEQLLKRRGKRVAWPASLQQSWQGMGGVQAELVALAAAYRPLLARGRAGGADARGAPETRTQRNRCVLHDRRRRPVCSLLSVTSIANVNVDLQQRRQRKEGEQRVGDVEWRSLRARITAAKNARIHTKLVNKVHNPRGSCHPRGARIAPKRECGENEDWDRDQYWIVDQQVEIFGQHVKNWLCDRNSRPVVLNRKA